jgi:indolepyruvate ferredoxin oxidoreductase
VQALVRLPMMQRSSATARRAEHRRLHLGLSRLAAGRGFDQELWQARKHLEADTTSSSSPASTRTWRDRSGAPSRPTCSPARQVDGVFGMWYGKGPGVDRAGDVLKHANAAGTSPHGGVLALAGDDHGRKSRPCRTRASTPSCRAMMPDAQPGRPCRSISISACSASRCRATRLLGRLQGDLRDGGARPRSVDPHRIQIVMPDRLRAAARRAQHPLAGSAAGREAPAWYEENGRARLRARQRIDRIVIDTPTPRFGIVTTGKAYLDVRQALEDLGIDDAAAALGIRVYKVGMTWPLEAEGAHAASPKAAGDPGRRGEALHHRGPAQGAALQLAGHKPPRVVGKYDESGRWILPSDGELTPARDRPRDRRPAERFHNQRLLARGCAFLEAKEALAVPRAGRAHALFLLRLPAQHSTKVPEGSRALAGIGCHYMVTGWTAAPHLHPHGRRRRHLGRPGAVHRHAAHLPEPRRRHLFHSGCWRSASRSPPSVNITYKILYNDAVAMTGGQPVDGR